ncbi:hypothetical protein DBR43_01405 [Pedobacter sp. KBW06]|uniref:hypothetical protein n=1 Tax=Pedobacter sp. KBW06 TaxID=2153359 RepID=UPI000F5B43CB|nr:hypothetical protein [Pedobacter sp. KBW06]RQO74091.1 hypothetical protein DBR43_01405 [Pedobacter sp. KBW06]
MARFKGKFLVGSIGNLTFKKNKKEQIVQTKPGKRGVKQTTATKKAALVFGKASQFSNCVRTSFRSLTKGNYDGEMINRLNKENFAILRQCYQTESESYDFKPDSFKRLNGFDFNSKSPLKDNLWIEPSVQVQEKELLIQLPDFEIPADFKFPGLSNTCSLMLKVYLLSIKTGFEKGQYLEILQISNDQKIVPAQEWKLEIPDGCICVTGMALNYYRIQGNLMTPVNHKEFNPAVILNATVSNGEFNLPLDSSWQFSGFKFQPDVENENAPNDHSSPETKPE